MKKIQLRKVIHEAEALPRGYGAAYRNFITGENIAYPVPLNLLVRWGRDLWWAMARYRLSTRDRAMHQAYMRGLQAAGLEVYLQHWPECDREHCSCGLDEKLHSL